MVRHHRHVLPPELDEVASAFQEECRDLLAAMIAEADISMRGLGRATDLSGDTITRFLDGRKGTTLKTFAGLAAAMGWEIELVVHPLPSLNGQDESV
jgi:hypothetical protein